jgi:predicted RNase H-like HicB family nuclease
VAWWDRSRDKRFASNSFLAGYGYDSAEAMLDDAVNLYPEVMSRQTRPVPDKVSV